MKKKISFNVFFSCVLQVVTIICGLIVPRLILKTLGSEVNGLLSSLTQLLAYVSLLEGGVSSVMMASLYRPLVEKDTEHISSIIRTIKGFFGKLSGILTIYTIVLGSVYPFFVKTSFSWAYIFSLTIILSLNTIIQYVYASAYRLLLNADNKVYITAIIQIISLILNTVLVYLGFMIYPNIHFIKLITAFVFMLQPIYYSLYVNKHYDLIKKCPKDEKAISQRWDGFGINIAFFVHQNTDIVLLTIFTNLFTVSVYSVYHIVFNGIKAVINAIFNGMNPTLGHLLAKENEEELVSFYEMYEFLSFSVSALFFSIGIILIVPFVTIYTTNINDANYYQPLFAVIMMLAEFFYCIRNPYVNLAYQSGHFRDISKYAYTEAIINIVVSVILVKFFGLIGVAIGTLAANIYRTVMQVVFSKKIIDRKYSVFIKYTFVFFFMIIACFVISKLLDFKVTGIVDFIICGVYATGISVVLYAFIVCTLYSNIIKKLLRSRKKKGE